jgi:hypothetical protein
MIDAIITTVAERIGRCICLPRGKMLTDYAAGPQFDIHNHVIVHGVVPMSSGSEAPPRRRAADQRGDIEHQPAPPVGLFRQLFERTQESRGERSQSTEERPAQDQER